MDRKVNVNIKTLTGKTLTLSVSLDDTVLETKLKVLELEGTPIDQQRLIYAGKQLEDLLLLAGCGVHASSTMHMVLRLRGGGCGVAGRAVKVDATEADDDDAVVARVVSGEARAPPPTRLCNLHALLERAAQQLVLEVSLASCSDC